LFTFLLTKLLGFIKQQQLYLNATCFFKLYLTSQQLLWRLVTFEIQHWSLQICLAAKLKV